MLEHEPSWGEVRQRSLLRNSLYALCIALCSLVLTPAIAPNSVAPAQAVFAPDGTGLYKGTIDWMEWGANTGLAVANNQKATSTRDIAGQELTTTCTISNISGTGGVSSYRSGMYDGDSLDDLYFKGSAGKTNQLIYGLATATNGATVSFKVSCSATLGAKGVPNPAAINLGGLVVADAESSNKSQGEYISAKPDQQSATWRVIERSRSCATSVLADLASDKTLKLYPDGEQCRSIQPSIGNGPMAIGYMEGATSATLSLKGGGVSAIALGVVLESDFGDAPLSYGAAGALFQPTWTGGALPVANGTNVFASGFTLGIPGQPIPRLGALTDSDISQQYSDNADLDDLTGVDDEDAIAPMGKLSVVPGQPYTLSNVACTGAGLVAGWLDWNANGIFDAGERSAEVSCPVGSASVSLKWTVPTSGLPTEPSTQTFLRLRIAKDSAGVASPLGMSTSGEVEDHALKLSVPTLSIQKDVSERVTPNDQFKLSLNTAGQTEVSATTTGNVNGVQTVRIQPKVVLPGTVFTFTESMATGSVSPLSEYDSKYSCTATYPGGDSSVLQTAVSVSGTITIPAFDPQKGAPAIACIFANAPKPATLSVTKSWVVNGTTYVNGAQPAGIQAQLTLAGANQAWNTPKPGYAAGQKVAISETMSIAAAMPGCTLEKARVTSLNGAGTDVALSSYVQTLKAGANTATVTNTLTCTTNLTLVKEVVGGTVQSNAWTLAGYPSTGPAVVQGTTGVTAKVTAGVSLQLGESGGSALYVQDDSRSPEERTQAPRSTGSWACSAVDGLKNPVAGVVTGRMGTNGTITPALGSSITCTATNRTAELTILKKVENVNGTGTGEPKDWNLTATPASGMPGLLPTTKQGAGLKSPVNTFNVRPGHGYLLSEDGTLGGYVQVGLERFTGSDPTLASEIESDANWASVPASTAITVEAGKTAVYRFVNRDAKRFDLPLTGGSGTTGFLLGGGFAASLSLGAAIMVFHRRRTTKKLP